MANWPCPISSLFSTVLEIFPYVTHGHNNVCTHKEGSKKHSNNPLLHSLVIACNHFQHIYIQKTCIPPPAATTKTRVRAFIARSRQIVTDKRFVLVVESPSKDDAPGRPTLQIISLVARVSAFAGIIQRNNSGLEPQTARAVHVRLGQCQPRNRCCEHRSHQQRLVKVPKTYAAACAAQC